MRQIQEHIVSQMLSREQGTLPASGWTEAEPLTGEGTKIVVSAFRIGTANTRDTLEIVAAGGKPFVDLPD